MRRLWLFTLLLLPIVAFGQSATIQWTDVHQVIDGFGAADAFRPSFSHGLLDFFFGTTGTDLGLTLMRSQVPDDGSCISVSSTCAGPSFNLHDQQYVGVNYPNVKLWAAPWSPPASMKTNGDTICDKGAGRGALISSDYASYATYLANYIRSLGGLYGIHLYALSVQNEPDNCESYPGALWTGANFDAFIKTNLGPTFSSDGITSLIIMPESSQHATLSSGADVCMTDPSCYNYVAINAWHDYDATYNPVNSASNPYASVGKENWETEASAGVSFGPSLRGGAWDPSMADGLLWAAIIDDRMAAENANAWNWWWLENSPSDTSNSGLIYHDGITVAKHAYVLGQYARFVRPGYARIGATHIPQSGVTISAYKGGGNLVIVATNQNSSSVSQTFTLRGTTATSTTPWITNATLSLSQQPSISIRGGSFTYTLSANSVTTFVGGAN